jgi:acyl-CoA dehydrogenase
VKLVLSERQLYKKEEFRRFAEEELELIDFFPHENLRKAAKLGYMGMPVPPEWGGLGEDFLTYIMLIEEISRVCASTGVIMAVHTSVGTFPLLYYGTEEQKERYLPRLAKGELLGAFALTEAGAGSDAAALATTAVPEAGGYLLNGSKLFISSGGEADLYTVFATKDISQGKKGICAFLVEKDTPGLSACRPEMKMGLHRSSTTELRMEDCFIPVSNRLGEEGDGFAIAMSLLDGGRIGIAAQGLGLAQASLDFTINTFRERELDSIKTSQSTSFALADMAARLEAARLLVYRATALKDSGSKCSREASMAKYFATDLAVEIASGCISLCGVSAMLRVNPLTRYLCDAKATQIYEGTNQIQRIVVSRELLNRNNP